MFRIPIEVRSVLEVLKNAGFTAYAVGGAVRDSLIGIKPYDWDITTSAKLESLIALFPDFQVVSEDYSVIRTSYKRKKTFTIDIATFRRDGAYTDGRRPDYVEFVDTIDEDLVRRDFTVNAICYDGVSLIDNFSGQEDIKQKLIRTIGEPHARFSEDPVRMLRAIRFSTELDFNLAENTKKAISDNCHLLSKVSTDRFKKECIKIIQSENAKKGIKLLNETGILDLILNDKL